MVYTLLIKFYIMFSISVLIAGHFENISTKTQFRKVFVLFLTKSIEVAFLFF